MERWVAISIIVILGVFLIVLLAILHTFGVYVKLITNTLASTVELRRNIAEQENGRAIDYIMRRRHDDPPPTERKEA